MADIKLSKPLPGEGPPRKPQRSASGGCFMALLRLGIVGLLALAMIVGGALYLRTALLVRADTAPTPSTVTIPDAWEVIPRDVTLTTADDVSLSGWYIPSRNGAAVILLHGYNSNRLAMRFHAEVLGNAGYGLLMYDQRASGQSEGTTRSWGWLDARDFSAAVDFLLAQPDVEPGKIGVAGGSIGGQIALRGAAARPEIAAVWADGPSVVRWEDDALGTQGFFRDFTILYGWLYDRVLAQQVGVDVPPGVVDVIGNIAPRPIYLVAGGDHPQFDGGEIPRIRKFADAAGDNVTVWEVPEAQHGQVTFARTDEYAERLRTFFDTSLDP
jgi:uncharacterized protein